MHVLGIAAVHGLLFHFKVIYIVAKALLEPGIDFVFFPPAAKHKLFPAFVAPDRNLDTRHNH
jgi:hypothetical protein